MSFTITEASLETSCDRPEHPIATAGVGQNRADSRPRQELEAENARLKAENERLLEDRELLVATVGIMVSM